MAKVPEAVLFEQVKRETANYINRAISMGLPLYQAAAILKDLYNEAQIQAQKGYQQQLEQYQSDLQKEDEANKSES